MGKQLKYEITVEGGEVYECKLEEQNNYYKVFIAEPATNGDSQEIFIENIVKDNDEWKFTKRTLPTRILNLEKELSDYLIQKEKK